MFDLLIKDGFIVLLIIVALFIWALIRRLSEKPRNSGMIIVIVAALGLFVLLTGWLLMWRGYAN